MISIQQILVPIDFSEPSAVAVKYAKAFAENFKSQLHFLHVVEDALVSWPAEDAVGMLAVSTVDDLEDQARKELAKLLTTEEWQLYRAQMLTIRGSASMEITSYAASEKIDLIIMGTHGRSPIAHMLMGSVAEKVLRKAPCPVLIVRHPEHEFVVP